MTFLGDAAQNGALLVNSSGSTQKHRPSFWELSAAAAASRAGATCSLPGPPAGDAPAEVLFGGNAYLERDNDGHGVGGATAGSQDDRIERGRAVGLAVRSTWI